MSDVYVLQHTPTFRACIDDFRTRDSSALAKLMEATVELETKPFGNPRLQTHRMKGVDGEKRFISDVGGRKGFRLIWSLVGRTIVLLLFGEHDVVERRGERLSLVDDAETGGIAIVERDPDDDLDPTPTPTPESRQVGQVFMAWTDAELAQWFADHEVKVLRRLDEEQEFFDLEDSMNPESFTKAMNLLLYSNPNGEVATRVQPDERQARREEVAAAESTESRELERRITSPKSRKHFAPITADALAEVLDKPIEDWMIFLHPEQAKLTQRPFSGPARIRGAAGTGKTVVALHRAKHLAETYADGRILFTTFVKNLPPVFGELFRRLAPDLAERVDFVHLHSWAARFLRQHGRSFVLDPRAADDAFRTAWRRHGPSGPIADAGLTASYVREELDWIIKGRGLRTVDEYLSLARTGRGTPLPEPVRRAVWDLYETYESELAGHGVGDFSDLLSRALELLQSGDVDTSYTAVLIDEAQDLTEVGLRLAYELAGRDRRDGLFLVGDGQQSVYPGGFSLGALGIDVRGRSALLKTNYRNTTGILAAASQIVANHQFDDGDDTLSTGRRQVSVVRKGDEPTVQALGSLDDHDLALAAAIEEIAEDETISTGDLAVLVPTNRLVNDYESVIQGLGLPTQKLQKYEGVPNDLVKVGTYQRGKGLEFKHVFLPRLDSDGLSDTPRHGEDDTMFDERMELVRRQLFVAMTRARDGLWLGAVGEPSVLLGTDEA